MLSACSAASEIELWSRATSAQVDAQLRERRKTFKRRRESLERIRTAASDLEARLAELEAQDQRLASIEVRLHALFERTRRAATRHELGLASDFAPFQASLPTGVSASAPDSAPASESA